MSSHLPGDVHASIGFPGSATVDFSPPYVDDAPPYSVPFRPPFPPQQGDFNTRADLAYPGVYPGGYSGYAIGQSFGSPDPNKSTASIKSELGAGDAGEKPAKSAATGAFPGKDGKYEDITDVLKSDEVQTFKKLRWGVPPV